MGDMIDWHGICGVLVSVFFLLQFHDFGLRAVRRGEAGFCFWFRVHTVFQYSRPVFVVVCFFVCVVCVDIFLSFISCNRCHTDTHERAKGGGE